MTPDSFKIQIDFRTKVASIGNAFQSTQKVSVLSLPDTTKKNSMFRTTALSRDVSRDLTHIQP